MPATKPYMRGDFPYRSIDDIQYANRLGGWFFFEASSMRFFRSRIADGIHGGRYFVTSEQFDYQSPRLYTVREALPSGRVESVSEFQAFTSLRQARRAADQYAENPTSVYFGRIVSEHPDWDWRKIATWCGLTHKGDRLELRRAVRAYERFTQVLP
jgi:hypothetical protein